MNPTVNQETNNVIFDIRDKVDKSKVIMEIFVAMIGLYMVFYRIKETKVYRNDEIYRDHL